MIILRKNTDLINYLSTQTIAGKNWGFVPTMGALHQGHLSLISKANKVNDFVVCSIFINPTQFNDPKDFEKYPVTIEQDIFLLEKAGCDLLFLPNVGEMYPEGQQAPMHFELGTLETVLDGKYRPGHFQGVCQVVYRLLNIVQPACLYLGQKDYQQCLVLKKMAGLYFPTVQIIICATERETSGLAMSSRNTRLTEQQKQQAVKIYTQLKQLCNTITPGNIVALKQQAVQKLTTDGFSVDYVEMANLQSLELLDEWDGKKDLVILIAAFLGEVRLIDNLIK